MQKTRVQKSYATVPLNRTDVGLSEICAITFPCLANFMSDCPSKKSSITQTGFSGEN